MHLGRTVVDAKCANLAEYLFDDGFVGHTRPANDLDAAIRDPHERLTYGDLRHRALICSERSRVQDARTPGDHQLGLLEVDQVVGKHEANSLVVDERLAERLPAVGIAGRDLVGADASA